MTDKFVITLVPQSEVRKEWKRVRKLLLPAIDRTNGRVNEAYVLADLVLGEQLLWIVLDEHKNLHGAVTTEIIEYPLKKIFTLNFTGGQDWEVWREQAFVLFNKFAKDMGCDLIEFSGRLGFWKRFKKDGFQMSSVFYEKRIDE